MLQRSPNGDQTLERIHDLLAAVGCDATTYDGQLVTQMIQTSLKLATGEHDTGQLKLINSSLKEMRYAYRVFNRYRGVRKITIFGSARTPEDHRDYCAARAFSEQMAAHGWMGITGAG
ncbi:MAG: LOG family protein, partial [Planctomycetota bacterium]